MGFVPKSAGLLLMLAAGLSHAAVPDPFPDQPGTLTAEEIRSASRAAAPLIGNEPFNLVASGRRDAAHFLLGYAVYAAPFKNFSSRVKTRRQIVCNFMRTVDRWQCSTPYDEFRMSANGLEHVFSYQVIQGPGDKQMAVDAADFMYSRCFAAQFAAVGGKPFTPSPDTDFVNTVVDDGKGLTVITGPLGEGDNYRLEKTDRKADSCGFRIVTARMAKSGEMLPESYAKEMEKQNAPMREKIAAEQRAQQTEGPRVEPEKPAQIDLSDEAVNERARIAKARADALAAQAAKERLLREAEMRERNYWNLGPMSISKVVVANNALWASIVVSFLTLLAPWVPLKMKGRWAAAGTALAFAAVGTLLGVASASYEPHYALLFGIPMVISWAVAVGFLVWAAVGEAITTAPSASGASTSSLVLGWIAWIGVMGAIALLVVFII